jgi:hypothetical protein
MENLKGYSSGARTLEHPPTGEPGNLEKKKKVIKDIIKKKGKDVFNPDPEIDEKDTIVKN